MGSKPENGNFALDRNKSIGEFPGLTKLQFSSPILSLSVRAEPIRRRIYVLITLENP